MGKAKFSIIFTILFFGLVVVAGEASALESFSSLDRNDDGVVSRSEWKWTTVSFRRKDANGDGRITNNEYYRRVYTSNSRQDYYNDDYVAPSNYPTTYPGYNTYNPTYTYNPAYAPQNYYNPGYAYNTGYGVNPVAGYGLNPMTGYGVNPMNVLGGLNGYNSPYVSGSAAKTGAAINLAGSLISSIMAFR